MKKILFITMNYYPSNVPDSKRITGFAELLAEKGYEITVVTSLPKQQRKFEVINGVNVIRKHTIGQDSSGMIKRLIKHTSFMLGSIFHRYKKSEFDIVYATSPALFNLISGQILKNKFNAKYIVELRDIWPEVFLQTELMDEKSIIYKVFNRIASNAYKQSDLIFAVTPRKVDLLKRQYPAYSDKIRYISNGFNMNLLDYEDDPEVLKYIQQDKVNVVYCGKVGLAQNLKDFVNLSKTIDPDRVNFLMLGTGNQLEDLMEYIRKEKINNVHYIGNRSEKEVVTILRNSQISFVSLSNSKLNDSVPTKLYESLVLGCPVLLSAEGDSADLVNEVLFGLTSSPGNLVELEENFLRLVNENEDFKASKQDVSEFIIKNYARKNIVNDVIISLNELLK